jgi:sodium/hydrogen antiporter
VLIGLIGSDTAPTQRVLSAWFGIRGIGSLYYLMYALTHGVEKGLAQQLVAIAAITVAVSILVHGISVTPLMGRYTREVQSKE